MPVNQTTKLGQVIKSGALIIACATTLLFGLSSGLAVTSSSDTNATQQARTSHRYLLVVETSKATQKRVDSILAVVNGLVASRFKEQLQPGDTIGVWTYNETLSAGKFPLQQWNPGNQKALASGLATFLKGEKYEKNPNLGSVIPALNKLAQGSHDITFIILSSGQETVSGTPFDEKINSGFTGWRDEQQKLKMPMLTIIRAWKGQYTGCKVAPAQWDFEFPAFPKETVVASAPKTNAPSVSAVTGTPLIVQGKKSSLDAPTATAMPAPVGALTAPQNVQPNSTVASSPGLTTNTETPVAAHANPAKVPSATITFSSTLTTNDPNKPVPAASAIPKFGVDSLTVPPLPPTTTPLKQEEKTAEPVTTAPQIVAKVNPLSTPVAARELEPAKSNSAEQKKDQAKREDQKSEQTQPTTKVPVVTQAVAAAGPSPFAQRTLWFSGGAVFGFLVIGFVLLAKRSVKQQRVSLITSSFERRGK